jgi:hypothetical protein
MKKKVIVLLSVAVMLLGVAGLATTAFAISSYLTAFNTRYGTSFDCSVCHVNPAGGGDRNAYGSAFEEQPKYWANTVAALTAIEQLPSRCAGYTNLQLINLGINPGSGACPASVALPAGAQAFPAYAGIASPVTDLDPAVMEPVAVGEVANGGATLDLSVNTGIFAGPVDMYLALFVPAISPDIFLVTPTGLQPLSTAGLVPWQTSVMGIDTSLFGSVSTAQLRAATYNLFLVVTPAGSISTFYFWQTSFVLP